MTAFSIKFPGDAKYLGLLQRLALAFAEKQGFSQVDSRAIASSLDEVLASMIERPRNINSHNKQIGVTFSPAPRSVKIEVRELAVGSEQPGKPRAKKRVGKKIFPFASKVMDKISIGKNSDNTSYCLMEKRLK